MLDTIRVIALTLTALPAWLFVGAYLIEWRHIRHTEEARHLIGFTLVLALITTEQLVRITVGPWPGRTAVVTILVVAGGTFLWQRLVMLLRHQVIPRWRVRHGHTRHTD